uniref:Uncharacterized protein n=1 Tax=Panagrolaimus davidi TaxID=227884 RepID=A0A914PQW2_9BILA
MITVIYSFLVKVTNSDGKSIIGVLSNDTDADIIEIVKSIQNRPSDNQEGCCILWRTKSKIPSTPSPLKKREGVIYYFIYFPAGSFGVIHSIQVQPYDCYYLLAEIDFEIQDGFEHTTNAKIEIL